MAFIGGNFPTKAGDVDLGDVTVEAGDPATAGTVKHYSGQRTDALLIPAGAYAGEIRIDEVDPNKVITINGEIQRYGDKFPITSFFDRANNNQDLSQQIVIENPNGASYKLSITYPSSSTVDMNIF